MESWEADDPAGVDPHRLTGRLRWKTSLGTDVNHVAVGDGAVFAATMNGTVHGLDKATGRQLWTSATQETLHHHLTVVDDVVYMGGFTHTHALDAVTGRPRWQRKSTYITAGNEAGLAGIVRAGSRYSVVGLDPLRGDIRWHHRFPAGEGGYDTAMILAEGRVHVALRSGLVTLDARTGEALWRHPWPPDSRRPIAAAEGVVCGIADSTLVAWETRSGAELWRRPTALRPVFGAKLVISGGRVYWTDAHYALEARDLATGRLRWQIDQHRLRRWEYLLSGPAVVGDTLHVVQYQLGDAALHEIFMAARCTETGDLRRTVPLDGRLAHYHDLTALAGDDGAVFFGVHAQGMEEEFRMYGGGGEIYAVALV